VQFGSTLQSLRADMSRLDDVLEQPRDASPDSSPAGPAAARLKLEGAVELRDVTFGYSPLDPPLIDHFSLSVEPGRRVALVGGSGSGKSTVAKLVAGLYQPWAGTVLLDGTPRAALPSSLITASVAMVDQEPKLFSGSITDNVAMWDTGVGAQRITKACRDAAIDEAIASRPDGYQSEVLEHGSNFSGGQAQRLEIARALAAEPTVLILDEATSALDATTEAEINERVRERRCTCLIVAHRLSTIRDAHEIIVMERGRIVQRGTHGSLKDADGPYRRLISY